MNHPRVIRSLMDQAMVVQHAVAGWWLPVEVAVNRSRCEVSSVRLLEESDSFCWHRLCGRPWFPGVDVAL